MKTLILTIIVSLFVISAYSQEVDSPIVKKGMKYSQNDQKLTKDQLYTALANNPASTESFQSWRKKEKLGLPFTYTGLGLALVGAGVNLSGTMKQKNDLDNGIYSEYPSGMGFILAGLAVEIVGAVIIIPARRKHLVTAVNQYNSSLNNSGLRPISLELMANSYGLGVRVRF